MEILWDKNVIQIERAVDVFHPKLCPGAKVAESLCAERELSPAPTAGERDEKAQPRPESGHTRRFRRRDIGAGPGLGIEGARPVTPRNAIDHVPESQRLELRFDARCVVVDASELKGHRGVDYPIRTHQRSRRQKGGIDRLFGGFADPVRGLTSHQHRVVIDIG